MKSTLLIVFMLSATVALGQRPKMDLKAYGGYHTHILKYKDGNRSTDVLHGWQGGFGFRVKYRQIFGEVCFNFVRSRVILPLPDSLLGDEDFVEFKHNSFELPVKVGYIPVKTALFKWYVYTGFGFRVNTKGILIVGDEEFSFKPKEVGLANPNVDFILGTQFDIASINVEILYSLGINNSIREGIRANSHEIHFNVGFWF